MKYQMEGNLVHWDFKGCFRSGFSHMVDVAEIAAVSCATDENVQAGSVIKELCSAADRYQRDDEFQTMREMKGPGFVLCAYGDDFNTFFRQACEICGRHGFGMKVGNQGNLRTHLIRQGLIGVPMVLKA